MELISILRFFSYIVMGMWNLTDAEIRAARETAFEMFREAGVPLRDEEREEIEVADFGLGDFDREGACIATLVATERYAAKALVLLPGQTLPEHWHPAIGDDPGKLETIRCVRGVCVLGIEDREGRIQSDEAEADTPTHLPAGKEHLYTCRHRMVLKPGDQLTLPPGRKHWFQGGPEGTVVYSFSSTVRDLQDGFTDPEVVR